MKTLILIIYLTITGFVSGQNLKQYYSNIYNAENCILNNEYDSCCFYYLKATLYKKLFAKDIYNYLVASIKARQFDISRMCIKELVKLGATSNSFSNNKTIRQYINNLSLKEKQSLSKIKTTYNELYRFELRKLQDRDQEVRKDVTAYTKNKETTKKVDKENIERLINLIGKYGFPSEQKVGIDEESFQIPHFPLLITHQRAGELQQYNFSSILTNAYQKGEINNVLARDLIADNNGTLMEFTVLRYQLVKLKDTTKPNRPSNQIIIDSTDWFVLDYSDSELVKLDKIRTEYNLEPFIEHIKKSIYSMTNSDFLLGSQTTGTSLLITDEKEFYKLKEKHKKTAYNKSICKSRAGHCSINNVQASAVVQARRSILGFSS
jgi:hypothetical protein